jgi:hypothetical protein
MRSILGVLLLSLLLTFSAFAGAETFLTASAIEKRLYVGAKSYVFTEAVYRPPVSVKLPVKRQDRLTTSPEQVLLAYLSSLVTHDTAWCLAVSERKEQERARLNPKAFDKDMKEAIEQADSLLKGNRVSFIKKETVGSKHLIIVIDVRDPGGDLIMTMPFALVQEDGQWRDCSTCNSSPDAPLYDLLLNFNFDFNGTESHVPKL